MVFFRLTTIFNCVGSCPALPNVIIRVLRKSIPSTLMETCLNKRFHKGAVACVLKFFVHFFVILCNAITIIKKI